MKYSAFLLMCFLPLPAVAAVSISEIAWMGSQESANHEWIELHNNGAAQDISGWVLTDSENLEIQLEGTLPANSYQVLERTSDASAPGSAFFIYTGSLKNSGATLTLRRADGSVADQVSGGENWQSIGGDNSTKETAQYTTSGWITAVATPGLQASASLKTESETKKPATKSSSGSSKLAQKAYHQPVKLELPDVTLQLEIDAPKIGYVHQPITFSVTPSGVGDHLIDSLQYQWNFGDGTQAANKEAGHYFSFPGTYVVVASAEFKRQRQVVRHEITILPVDIMVTKNSQGNVQINNDSPYEIDVSGYRVRGESVFIFPKHTILLPYQTITLSEKQLRAAASNMTAVYDTQGEMVAAWLPEKIQSATVPTHTVASVAPPPKPRITAMHDTRASFVPENPNFTFVEANTTQAEDEKISSSTAVAFAAGQQPAAVVESAAAKNIPNKLGYVGLVGLILLGVGAVYATPRRNPWS